VLSTRHFALTALSLAFLLNLVGRGLGDSYMVFVLPLEQDFGWRRSAISSVYSIYMLATGFSSYWVGRLYDKYGPRLVYCGGVFCLGLAFLLAGSLTQLWQFYTYIGVLAGVGVASLGTVPATMLVSRWFRDNKNTAIAISYAGFGAGTLLLVPLSQYFNDWFGWRLTYRTFGISLLVILPGLLLLPWQRLAGGIEVERAASRQEKQPLPAPPMTVPAAIKTPQFWALSQTFFFTGMGMYIILVQNVAFLIETGVSPMAAAGAHGMAGMLSVFGVIATGVLADRVGFKFSVTTSFVFSFIGLLALYLLSVELSYVLLVVYVLFFGCAQGARGPIIGGLSAILFPSAGAVYGVVYACMSVGAASGALISGVLYDVTGNYHAGFLLAATSFLLALRPFWLSQVFNTTATQ